MSGIRSERFSISLTCRSRIDAERTRYYFGINVDSCCPKARTLPPLSSLDLSPVICGHVCHVFSALDAPFDALCHWISASEPPYLDGGSHVSLAPYRSRAFRVVLNRALLEVANICRDVDHVVTTIRKSHTFVWVGPVLNRPWVAAKKAYASFRRI